MQTTSSTTSQKLDFDDDFKISGIMLHMARYKKPPPVNARRAMLAD